MTACFKCGQEFRQVWKAGKLQPLNVSDNRLHWATCAARGQNHPLKKKQNTLFQAQTATHKTGPRITGKDYSPSCGECQTPPWELCRCSFEWAKAGEASPFQHPSPPSAADRANSEAAIRFQHMLDLEAA